VIYREDGPAGDAEYRLDTDLLEGTDDGLCTAHLFSGDGRALLRGSQNGLGRLSARRRGMWRLGHLSSCVERITLAGQTKTPRPGAGIRGVRAQLKTSKSNGRLSAPAKYYDNRQLGHVVILDPRTRPRHAQHRSSHIMIIGLVWWTALLAGRLGPLALLGWPHGHGWRARVRLLLGGAVGHGAHA